jgi:hypothetical protein
VADHQAFLRVRDNTPHGSRFIIELPVRRREQLSADLATATPPQPTANGRHS